MKMNFEIKTELYSKEFSFNFTKHAKHVVYLIASFYKYKS